MTSTESRDHVDHVQTDIDAATAALKLDSSSAAKFQAAYDRLRPYRQHRDQMVMLMSHLSSNPNLLSKLCAPVPTKAEHTQLGVSLAYSYIPTCWA